ncbi:MAG: AAA family ATPase [Spirochaetota bacterium]|nr:MAG: AAA family ATPase [Spirochaetota bacterium]
MKLAITGKGGVGKTTIVTLLSTVLRNKGHKVLLIDADPDMNLATVLGISPSTKITPIVELKELIAERTGVEVGKPAPFFKMNPKVDDIPEKFCVEHKGLKLIVMGTIRNGGGGCACPENAFLKTLLSYLMIARDEWVILDMEAGIEHLGRGTAIGVNHMIVVVEPNMTSVETAIRIEKLSGELGIKNLHIIGNKIQDNEDTEFIKNRVQDIDILGFIKSSNTIKELSRETGQSQREIDGDSLTQIEHIINRLKAIPVESAN